jgi:hypothetical protein
MKVGIDPKSTPIGSELGMLSPHLHTWHPETPFPGSLIPSDFWPNLLVHGTERLQIETFPDRVTT